MVWGWAENEHWWVSIRRRASVPHLSSNFIKVLHWSRALVNLLRTFNITKCLSGWSNVMGLIKWPKCPSLHLPRWRSVLQTYSSLEGWPPIFCCVMSPWNTAPAVSWVKELVRFNLKLYLKATLFLRLTWFYCRIWYVTVSASTPAQCHWSGLTGLWCGTMLSPRESAWAPAPCQTFSNTLKATCILTDMQSFQCCFSVCKHTQHSASFWKVASGRWWTVPSPAPLSGVGGFSAPGKCQLLCGHFQTIKTQEWSLGAALKTIHTPLPEGSWTGFNFHTNSSSNALKKFLKIHFLWYCNDKTPPPAPTPSDRIIVCQLVIQGVAVTELVPWGL